VPLREETAPLINNPMQNTNGSDEKQDAFSPTRVSGPIRACARISPVRPRAAVKLRAFPTVKKWEWHDPQEKFTFIVCGIVVVVVLVKELCL